MSNESGKSVCPICEKPSDTKFSPFCSARCKDFDLNRWLNESYRIAGNPTGDESDGVGGLNETLGQPVEHDQNTRH